MIFSQGKNPNVASFILRVEKLFGYVLEGKKDLIFELRDYVQGMSDNIRRRDTLTEIKNNLPNILRVFADSFWEDLTFSDVEFLVVQIAPLMKYYEPTPKKVVQVDQPDFVILRETYAKEVKEDPAIKKLLDSNTLAQKIQSREGITASELGELK